MRGHTQHVAACATALVWLLAPSPASAQPPAAQAAFSQGRTIAADTINELNLQAPGTLAAPVHGYLIAEGDSWFSYPGLDVLGALSGGQLPGGVRYKVYSAASAGDTVESMAFDRQQLEGFAHEFVKVRDAGKAQDVKAILLSGGGNDIAGSEFHVLLNHANSSNGALSPLDNALADALIERIGLSLESLIGTAAHYAVSILGRVDAQGRPNVPILIHGYGLAVPDGRPFLFGWPLPGPWLQPGFAAKGYVRDDRPDALESNTRVIAQLIDRFNTRIATIPAKLAGVADVRYVNVRGVLNSTVAGDQYKQDWANELHPHGAAFVRVAAAFHQKIQTP